MGIETIFAHISCSSLERSVPWYAKLFGRAPDRRPMAGLAEWQFSESAEVQLYEEARHAGASTLTLGVLPLEPERARLVQAGLDPGEIEKATNFFLVRLRDPDQNLIVLASARRA